MTHGTFPYKLWDLINSTKDNGITWSKYGNKVIIDKIPFQKHCLNAGEFKTKNYLSITKQLNVYGFVQCVHPFAEEIIVYKNKNFKKGHPELLENFTRRKCCYSRSKNVEPVGESLEVHAKLPEKIHKKEQKRKIDRVTAARLNFRLILNENLKQVMQIPTGLSSSENEDTDYDDNFEVTTRIQPQFRAPLRQDPRLLMWNGSCIVSKPCACHIHHQTMIHPELPHPTPFSACQLTAWDSMENVEKCEDTPTFEFPSDVYDDIFLDL